MRTQPAPLADVEQPRDHKVVHRLRAIGFRYLHAIDAITLYAAMVAITIVRFGFHWPTFPVSHYAIGFAVATAMHIIVFYFGGMYEYEQRLGWPPLLPKATLLSGIAVLMSASTALATGRYLMPRGNLAAFFVVASILVTFNRWLARSLRSRRFGAPRVLLVGNPDDSDLARRHLSDSGRGATVVATTGSTKRLISEIDASDATDVLMLSGTPLEEIYPHPIDQLEHRLIGIYRRITPSDTLLGLQRSRQIAGMPFVALRTHAVPVYRLRLKRALDLAVLVVLSPVVVVVCVSVASYVRIRAGKGVIYRQNRVGREGQEFSLLKFRTMRDGAESMTGPTLATDNDPRIVPGLAWLRAARLDELPQLWNVIRGEMSIVGPRPERPEFTARLEEILPGYGRRHDIPPGITGLAQVHGHYQTDPGYKLGHDLQYIVNWSPVLDLTIMLQTVIVMLRRSAR